MPHSAYKIKTFLAKDDSFSAVYKVSITMTNNHTNTIKNWKVEIKITNRISLDYSYF